MGNGVGGGIGRLLSMRKGVQVPFRDWREEGETLVSLLAPTIPMLTESS